jgi:hypothetical protein
LVCCRNKHLATPVSSLSEGAIFMAAKQNITHDLSDQGDRVSLCKTHPKCSPTHFLSKIHN